MRRAPCRRVTAKPSVLYIFYGLHHPGGFSSTAGKMFYAPLVMRPTTDQKIPVNFIMDNRTASRIKIGCTADIIPVQIKVMAEKKPNLPGFVLTVGHLDLFDVDV